MHPATKAVFDEMDRVEWFGKVGSEDIDHVKYAHSWEEALRLAVSVEWENTGIAASNALHGQLLSRAPKRLLQWNKIVRLLKKFTIPWVKTKIAMVVEEIHPPKDFESAVQWDILGVGIEAEYSNIVPPGFYTCLKKVYMAGHFPCGWEGKSPSGRLIIW